VSTLSSFFSKKRRSLGEASTDSPEIGAEPVFPGAPSEPQSLAELKLYHEELKVDLLKKRTPYRDDFETVSDQFRSRITTPSKDTAVSASSSRSGRSSGAKQAALTTSAVGVSGSTSSSQAVQSPAISLGPIQAQSGRVSQVQAGSSGNPNTI
jgi:hypothetical protein